MNNIIGAAFVMSGCAALGLLFVKRLNDRTRALWKLVSSLDYISAEIKHGLTPLPDILNKLFGGNNEITSDTSLSDRWSNAIKTMPLGKAEKQALEELGMYLGRFGQDAAIERTREQIYAAYVQAKDEQRVKGKLYSFMGIGLGLLIVIMVV